MDVKIASTQSAAAIPLPYAMMLLGEALILFQYIFSMYFFTMAARLRAFNSDFMKQFDNEHEFAFPERPKRPQYGYPDCGNGYYSKKLSYAAWFDMNNGQRVQLNFLEQLPIVMVSTLVGGFAFPWVAFAFQLVFFIGRLLYSFGYTKCGPSARVPGAMLCNVTVLGAPCLAVASVVYLLI